MGKTAGKSGRPANTNRTPLILSPDRSRAEHAKYDCATQHLTQQLWSERENSTNPYGRAEEVMDLRVSRMRDYAWLEKSCQSKFRNDRNSADRTAWLFHLRPALVRLRSGKLYGQCNYFAAPMRRNRSQRRKYFFPIRSSVLHSRPPR